MLPRLNMVCSGAQVWMRLFCLVVTQRAEVKSVEGEGVPKEPWRGCREVGARRRFSGGLLGVAWSWSWFIVVVVVGVGDCGDGGSERCKGMGSLMARWVRGGLELVGEIWCRMAVQRGSFWEGVREDSRAGQGADEKLPLGRRTMGS